MSNVCVENVNQKQMLSLVRNCEVISYYDLYCSTIGFCKKTCNAHMRIATVITVLILYLWLFISADRLIKVRHRRTNTPLLFSENYSVLLVKNSHLSLLLVHEHALIVHNGAQLTLSVLSRCYWILHSNSLIKSEIKQCARFKGVMTNATNEILIEVLYQSSKALLVFKDKLCWTNPAQKMRAYILQNLHLSTHLYVNESSPFAESHLSVKAFIAILDRFTWRGL